MSGLNGKTALVTGSVQGIGLAVAKALAGADVRIAVHGLASPEEADAAVTAVRAAGAPETILAAPRLCCIRGEIVQISMPKVPREMDIVAITFRELTLKGVRVYDAHDFERAIHLELGRVEVDDQLTGVDFLRSLDYVDPERIGIFGWSYGGYMALMASLKAPDTFAAVVAVAPVTDWRLYDTHYTERYMGHPEESPDGYEKSGVFPYVEGLKGDLLIIHGMADDNVLFTNSTKLFKMLQDNDIHFEMMTYPGSKHGLRGKQVQTHYYKTSTRFFDRTLK